MKRLLLNSFAIAALAIATTFSANAQISAGVSGGLGLPMGDFGKAANMGFGGGLHGDYAVNDNIKAGASFGYFMFSGIDQDFIFFKMKSSYTMMPICVHGEYYFMTEGFKPYVGLDVGLFMLTTTVDMTMSLFGVSTSTSASASNSQIGFAPYVGAAYGLSDVMDLFGNVKYNYVTAPASTTAGVTNPALTYIGINVGINYKFGK